MNTKTFLASVMMLTITVLQSPGQQAQAAKGNVIVVNVLGQVNRPARIALPSGATLLDAIASTGGLTRIARPSKLVLIHKTKSGKLDSMQIDFRPIMNGFAHDIKLRDGDTVVVSESLY